LGSPVAALPTLLANVVEGAITQATATATPTAAAFLSSVRREFLMVISWWGFEGVVT
jgi:hypothetical protein